MLSHGPENLPKHVFHGPEHRSKNDVRGPITFLKRKNGKRAHEALYIVQYKQDVFEFLVLNNCSGGFRVHEKRVSEDLRAHDKHCSGSFRAMEKQNGGVLETMDKIVREVFGTTQQVLRSVFGQVLGGEKGFCGFQVGFDHGFRVRFRGEFRSGTGRLSHVIPMSLAGRYAGPAGLLWYFGKCLNLSRRWFVFAWFWCGPGPAQRALLELGVRSWLALFPIYPCF